MKKRKDVSIFGAEEKKYYLKLRDIRERAFSPIADFFVEMGLSPSNVSFIGVLCMIPFVFLFAVNPWLSLIFLALSVFLDSIDGVMARSSGTDSGKGAFVDFTSDYLVYFVVFFTLLWYGLVGSFWGSLHLLNYLVMQFFIIYANFMEIEVFPVIRSKFLIYLFFLIWLISGNNYFDPLMVMMTVYMLVTNFFIYHKIKWAL